MYESDDVDEAIKNIPLKNLPRVPLQQFAFEDWKEGDPVLANNVLIGAIGQLDSVSLVGRSKEDGSLLFASSIEDIDQVIQDLNEFKNYLKRYVI